MNKKIFISAGEPSGDLHASNLIKELKKLEPNFEFSGIGCDNMEALGVRMLHRMDKLSIIGLWEVFSHITIIRNIFGKIKKEIGEKKIDLAILIDYPGFNLYLAKMLYKRRIPCIYYITPQLWAWGKWRINNLRRYVKKALVILKFEEDFYKKENIDAAFVGHPLLDEDYKLMPVKEAKALLNLNPEKFTIALVPGSRHLEVKRMLPVMIGAVKLLKNYNEIQFLVSQSPNVDEKIYRDICKDFDAVIVKSDIYKCLNAADFVFTSSGTVTLQIAIAEKPMLIIYIMSSLTALFGKLLVKIPDIGLVNIIAKKRIVPEAVQGDARPEVLAEKIEDIIYHKEKISAIKEDLREVKNALGLRGASERAAKIIYQFARTQQ